MAFQPSTYQQAIFNWVQQAKKGQTLVISAVPGSGKTTTIVKASSLVKSTNKVFLAFNKSIATELAKKMPDTECSTLHSLGYRTLSKAISKRLKVDGLKYHKILKELMPKADYYDCGTDVVKLLELAQCNLLDASDPHLLDTYNINPVAYDFVSEIDDALRIGVSQAKSRGTITYNDMIWLVDRLNLKPQQYEWAFIDESQDLNAMQISMVKKLADINVFVGDENQSIYGFAGALDDSMDKIRKAFKAEVLPLSICYRCPTSHISLANTVFDTIEARSGAPEGVCKEVDENQFYDGVKGGDLVLSRVTAPLVSACFTLLAEGKGAYIAGRDIEAGLISIVKKLAKMDKSFDRFGQTLESWQVIMESKAKSEQTIQTIQDKVSTLMRCYDAWAHCQSYDDFTNELTKLFEDKANCIKLSTVHRAKGLEAQRVWVFQKKLPLQFPNQRSWEQKQEQNLQYVAYTRSMGELYLVDNN
jgi:DNA helicase-2/ATP-dependent DNA helicase PcrA